MTQRTRTWLLTLLLIGGIIAVIAYVAFIASGLPSLEELENPRPALATKVFSIDGEVIDKYFEENRTRITDIDSVPKAMIHALIATEDRNFYNHWGVNLRRLIQLAFTNLASFSLRGPGGSTITQQLAKNLYFSPEVSITRKIREAITAIQIERRYTKNEILMMYLNVAQFGRGAYGLQSAAQAYFDKTPMQLSPGECAFLVGALKAPSHYDPNRSYQRAIKRRNIVLHSMLEEEYLTDAQFLSFKQDSIITRSPKFTAGIAPNFVEYVRQQLRESAEKYGFNLYRDGISVYTTLDTRMQSHAIRAVRDHLAPFQREFDAHWDWETPRNRSVLAGSITRAAKATKEFREARNADARELALIRCRRNPRFVDSVKRSLSKIQVGFAAIDPRTGYIHAMVGNSEMNFKYGLNHVTQIQRQPGSAMKPFVYSVAIDNGYSPAFELANEPISIDDGSGRRWNPQNFGGELGGKMTLRKGLALSVNLVAIRAILEIAPVEEVIRYAHRMGIESELRPFPSLAIGTSEVVPLEIISAYGAFPNEGIYVKPISILRIEDRDGRVIEVNTPEVREVLSKETAFIMTSMMQSVINGGTGSVTRSYFTLPAGGKTGTTQDYADAWFIGFTRGVVAGAWVGFDDRRITFTGSYGQGSRAAAPIWASFMKYAYQDKRLKLKAEGFEQPAGVVQEKICGESHNLATQFCPNTTTEYFNKKYLPMYCTVHSALSSPRSGDKQQIEY